MKLIKPSYEIMSPIDRTSILRSIEKAGRTCYKSENRITETSASHFVRNILKSGHESVIEHCWLTVKFICDRGVTHELVRHRLVSYSQESTRYCNYGKDKFGAQITFIIPCWFENIPVGEYKKGVVEGEVLKDGVNEEQINYSEKCDTEREWLLHLLDVEEIYLWLVCGRGWTPQQARSVLPNALKTEIITTANLREWRHILKLRTSERAHPQIREIMVPLLKELHDELPELFEDIYVKGKSTL